MLGWRAVWGVKGRHAGRSGNKSPGGMYVSVSWGRWNKVPPVGWLKTTAVHFLTVLEA